MLAGLVLELIVGGLYLNAYGAYLVALRAEFGWSATVLSLGFAFARVEHGLLGPFQGWLVDRYGPRRVVTAGVLMSIAGFLLLSQVTDIETFFASILVIAVGASLGGFSSVAVAVVNWFERHRTTALGIVSAGFAASSALVPLVLVGFQYFGWRTTAVLSGLTILIIGLPAAQLLRHRPQAYGLHPDGARPPDPLIQSSETGIGTEGSASLPPRAFTLRHALRARQFWYLSLGHACAVLVVSAVIVHLVAHLIGSLGLTLAETSVFLLMLSVLMILGTLLGGAAGDRIGRRDLLVACMAGHALGILLLAHASAGWMVGAFALLHGLAWGVRGPLMSSIRADFFGLTAFGTITGMSSLVVTLGMIGGPLVAGLAHDLTGSYTMGFTVIAGFAAFGAGFFVLAIRAAARSEPSITSS